MREFHCSPLVESNFNETIVSEDFLEVSLHFQFLAFSEDGLICLAQVLSETYIPIEIVQVFQPPFVVLAIFGYFPVDKTNYHRSYRVFLRLLQSMTSHHLVISNLMKTDTVDNVKFSRLLY